MRYPTSPLRAAHRPTGQSCERTRPPGSNRSSAREGKDDQDQDQAVLQDLPREAQPASVLGGEEGDQRGPDRDQHEKADERGALRQSWAGLAAVRPAAQAAYQLYCACRLTKAGASSWRSNVTSSHADCLSQQRARQLVVQRVARLVRAERADYRVAQQVQVADRVEHLVLRPARPRSAVRPS